jgi:hypothetical protein
MFFKKRSQKDSNNDTSCWYIHLIDSGLRCNHKSGNHTEYFERDQLEATGSFSERKPLTPLEVFSQMMLKTPRTEGFSFKSWNIVNHEGKGFVVRKRVNLSSKDVEIEHRRSLETERYFTNETLESIDIMSFLQQITETYYGKTNA